MNTNKAKSIALPELLVKLGFQPTKVSSSDYWYLSPLRSERTASFHVNAAKNVWYDHGSGEGGSTIDFVCSYLQSCGEDHTVSDALRWLDNMLPSVDHGKIVSAKESFGAATTKLSVRKVLALENRKLLSYLKTRGISESLGRKYLKEVHVFNEATRKKFFALGMRNEEKGFELRNDLFKGCVEAKAITFIRGAKPMTTDIHVFEGMFDFLSALLVLKVDKLDGDCIVLHSTACLNQAFPYLHNYGYKRLFSWMDNDHSGKTATMKLDAFIKQQVGLTHKPMNKHYEGHKDVNEWHLSKLSAPKRS